MTKIIHRENGKKILLDTEKDNRLYDSKYAHYRRTGSDNATRGIDLYAKEIPNEEAVFYTEHWSAWQGEACYIEPLDLTEAQKFVEENFNYFDEEDIEELEKLGLINMDEVL